MGDLRVLVVDDDPPQREDLVQGLKGLVELGLLAPIDTAGAEREALDRVAMADEPYDIIVLDLRMERRDSGLRVLKALKTNPRCERTEFLVLTVVEAQEVRDEVHRLGADLYLEKTESYPPIALIRERMRGAADRVRLRRCESENARLSGEPRPGAHDHRRAFSAMPFRPGFDDIYLWIEVRAAQRNITAFRSDRRPDARYLLGSVFDEIRVSRFFVCDVTDTNPNVLLELGMALALGALQPDRKVLVLAEKDAELPVDIQGLVVTRYDRLNLRATLLPSLDAFFADATQKSAD